MIPLYLCMPWSCVDTEYRTDQAQHTPRTVSTQDCLSFLLSHDYELTPDCSFILQRASLSYRSPPASSPWELKGKVTSSDSHSCKWTHWSVQSQHPVCLLATASKFFIQSHCIRASKCISKLAWSQRPCRSWSSLDYGLQLYLQTRTITASKFAWSWAPKASPNSLDHSLQGHLWVQLDLGLQMHLQTPSIMAPKFAQ